MRRPGDPVREPDRKNDEFQIKNSPIERDQSNHIKFGTRIPSMLLNGLISVHAREGRTVWNEEKKNKKKKELPGDTCNS